MNITKELLRDLGVSSMSLSDGALDYLCFMKKFDKNSIIFSLLKPAEFDKNKKIILKITSSQNNFPHTDILNFTISEYGEDYCSGSIEDTIPDSMPFAKSFFEKLKTFEYNDEKYGRRQENRIKIGKEKFRDFGLLTPEQILFVQSAKLAQPCAIIDASIHGIKIITPYNAPIFKDIENFNIKLSFVNPNEGAILKVHKVHSQLNKTENKIFATLSCQLLEPIPHIWKGRVISLMEKLA